MKPEETTQRMRRRMGDWLASNQHDIALTVGTTAICAGLWLVFQPAALLYFGIVATGLALIGMMRH